jgi:hypothetical protein
MCSGISPTCQSTSPVVNLRRQICRCSNDSALLGKAASSPFSPAAVNVSIDASGFIAKSIQRRASSIMSLRTRSSLVCSATRMQSRASLSNSLHVARTIIAAPVLRPERLL